MTEDDLKRFVENIDNGDTSQQFLDAYRAALELCRNHGLATGHGDTLADIIREIDGQISRPRKPHKTMTTAEYYSFSIIGWHEVCRDVDGFGGVGIRSLGADGQLARDESEG